MGEKFSLEDQMLGLVPETELVSSMTPDEALVLSMMSPKYKVKAPGLKVNPAEALAAQTQPAQTQAAQAQQEPTQAPDPMAGLMAQYNRSLKEAKEAEEAGISEQEQMLKKFLEAETRTDISPFLAYVDSATGSKFAQAYERPMSENDKQKLAMGFQNQINERKGALSKSQADSLKSLLSDRMAQQRQEMQNDRFDKLYGERVLNRGLREAGSLNKIYDIFDKDPVMVETFRRNTKIYNDLHVLDSSPEITKALATDLARGIASALGGSNAAGWHEVQNLIPTSLYGDLAAAKEWLTGDPQETITPEQKVALRKMLIDLQDAYNNISRFRTTQLKEGRGYENEKFQKALDAKANAYLNAGSMHGSGGHEKPAPAAAAAPQAPAQAETKTLADGRVYKKNPQTGLWEQQ